MIASTDLSFQIIEASKHYSNIIGLTLHKIWGNQRTLAGILGEGELLLTMGIVLASVDSK